MFLWVHLHIIFVGYKPTRELLAQQVCIHSAFIMPTVHLPLYTCVSSVSDLQLFLSHTWCFLSGAYSKTSVPSLPGYSSFKNHNFFSSDSSSFLILPFLLLAPLPMPTLYMLYFFLKIYLLPSFFIILPIQDNTFSFLVSKQ